MPSPDTSLATLRPDLGSSFQEFDLAMQSRGFIATQVLPPVEVGKQSGTYGIVPVEQLLKNRDTLRAPGSGYARQDFKFDDVTYACDEHGAEDPVDDRERSMYADFFDAETIASARARNAVMQNLEARVAALIFNATTWTGASLTTAVTNEWDDGATATPLDDVEAAVQKVYDNSGLVANALIIGWKTFRDLRNVTTSNQIVDRLKYSGIDDVKAGNMTADMLAQAFALDHVFVGGSVKNSANEGQAASVAQVWSGEYAMVCKVATSSDFKEPCIGRIFHWGEDGSSIGGTVESYREESKRSDIVRVRMDTDELVLYTQAGHLLSNITT